MVDLAPLIFDIEIKRAIQSKGEARVPGIEYCGGWGDHAGMGISVLCAYDMLEDRPRIFCDDNLKEFRVLAEQRLCVGYNSLAFDNKVLLGTIGWAPEHNHDLFLAITGAAFPGEKFNPSMHRGFGLDAMCQKNYGAGKSGDGAHAPLLYQRGQMGELIDYCMTDVIRTKQLFEGSLYGPLERPDGGVPLTIPIPEGRWFERYRAWREHNRVPLDQIMEVASF